MVRSTLKGFNLLPAGYGGSAGAASILLSTGRRTLPPALDWATVLQPLAQSWRMRCTFDIFWPQAVCWLPPC